ncbi:MAG: ribosomal-protein-alanine N-acetyltransferase [Alphaproteobacteria bacterium]|nr:MAG: ribosomal-protein-alanine N-acetyltransferase [Alphaproteobacteria bacterium]
MRGRHLFLRSRRPPVLSVARAADAGAFALLHGESFHRAWAESEFAALLAERNVLAHRATAGRSVVGFILSRMVAAEAEILSVAVAPAARGKGLGRQLLDVHLRRLAGLGVRAVFLEVAEDNMGARAIYQRSGFRDAGRREAYYPEGKGAAALILRRDLV